jgi:hypothetical protein
MKFFAFIIFLLPIAVAGQSKTDYENAMSKFQKFYNTAQGDSINAMFGHIPDDMKSGRPLWTNDQNEARLKEFGILKSFKFIGIDNSDPNKVYVFKTIFSKAGTKTTSLTLFDDLSLGTFRFITTSESINNLLRKSKSRR